MKNWKTTLGGVALGLPIAIEALVEAYTAGYFTNEKGLQLAGAILVVVIGSLLKGKPKN